MTPTITTSGLVIVTPCRALLLLFFLAVGFVLAAFTFLLCGYTPAQ